MVVWSSCVAVVEGNVHSPRPSRLRICWHESNSVCHRRGRKATGCPGRVPVPIRASGLLNVRNMQVFVLEIKADLENIATLELPEGYSYCIDVKSSTGDDQRDGVYITSTNEEDLHGSRGSCNFQVKWVKDAKSSAYVLVQETVKGVTKRQVTEDESGQWVPIAGFDCRGLEPIGFHPENGWKAVSTGGTVFDDVDLREDWAEFCEKIAESVGIYAVEGRFRRI